MEQLSAYQLTLKGQHSNQIVVFNTMPAFYENNSASYVNLSPQHLVGDYKIFEHSNSRSFEFGEIKLVSRNQKEARENLGRIQILKAWTKPYFGSTEGSLDLVNWLGAPPEVVFMSMFNTADSRGIFNNIPTIVDKVGIDYPNDCDYIPTAYLTDDDPLGGLAFPLITKISLSLIEQHSPFEYESFNLDKYRSGTLSAW